MTDNDQVLDSIIKRITALEQNGIPGVKDFFATSALSILSNPNYKGYTPNEVASLCYSLADAMMAERNK